MCIFMKYSMNHLPQFDLYLNTVLKVFIFNVGTFFGEK